MSSFPATRFVVLEKSSHLPFTEEPGAFVRTMEDFLQAKSDRLR